MPPQGTGRDQDPHHTHRQSKTSPPTLTYGRNVLAYEFGQSSPETPNHRRRSWLQRRFKETRKRSTVEWLLVVVTILLIALLVVTCKGRTRAETKVKVPARTPWAGQEGTKTLIVCLGQEPDSLYIYGSAMLTSKHIQQAFYDGPIDNRSFGYQPIILEKLPYLVDGDAVIQKLNVTEGDWVVNSAGDRVKLVKGTVIRPAGCRASDCTISYQDGQVKMERMQATFVLKKGIRWSDGEPVKASDSVYSFELSMDPDTPTHSRYVGERTASYEALDGLTVVWTGLPGYLDATYFVNFWTPLPEHAWGGMTAAEIVRSEQVSHLPIGYGPFKIVEWVAGDHISVVRNPYYFRANEGLPYLDKITFRFIGEQPNAAIGALLANDCDILTQDLHLDEQAKLLIDLESAGELVPIFVTGTVWEHADLGINPTENYERPDFFQDVRVRQAIAMCLDTQSVIDAVLYGRSTKVSSYIPPEHPLYNPDVKVWDYDPETAQTLLEEVGWIDADGDGTREAHGVAGIPDGTKLAFTWMSTAAEIRVAYTQIYQKNLLECGIDLTLKSLPVGEYFANGPEGLLWGRRFDVASFAWLTGSEPPCALYLSSQIPSEDNGWAGQNNPGFSDAEYDAACNAALQSLPGTPEYERHHKEAQRIFSEKLPVIPLFLRLKLAVYAPYVSGFIVDSTENSEMWNIEAFDVDE